MLLAVSPPPSAGDLSIHTERRPNPWTQLYLNNAKSFHFAMDVSYPGSGTCRRE